MEPNERPAWANATPQEFMAWLTTNLKNIVGQTSCKDCCPYYHFLTEIYKAEIISVGRGIVTTLSEAYPHPDWLKNFISNLDTHYWCSDDKNGEEVTGEQCLVIMNKIMEKLNGSENTQQS